MKKVVIYAVDYCPYCQKAKKILSDKNIPFEEIDITKNEDEMLSELTKKTGIDTVPQIFIDNKFIGGSDKLSELNLSGELEQLLK
ncbi:MAG: glutaredoxin 3 [Candidatus Gastranaerophilaceae bacterium]|jgi:glutaredoxin 3